MSIGLEILCTLIIVFGVASLASKDNFYSALYMSLTMVCVASLYALYGVHSAFALITLVFIGALGAITLVLAYSYREERSVECRLRWITFALIVAIILALVAPFTTPNHLSDYISVLLNFEPIYMLISLTVLVMVTLIEVWRCRS